MRLSLGDSGGDQARQSLLSFPATHKHLAAVSQVPTNRCHGETIAASAARAGPSHDQSIEVEWLGRRVNGIRLVFAGHLHSLRQRSIMTDFCTP